MAASNVTNEIHGIRLAQEGVPPRLDHVVASLNMLVAALVDLRALRAAQEANSHNLNAIAVSISNLTAAVTTMTEHFEPLVADIHAISESVQRIAESISPPPNPIVGIKIEPGAPHPHNP